MDDHVHTGLNIASHVQAFLCKMVNALSLKGRRTSQKGLVLPDLVSAVQEKSVQPTTNLKLLCYCPESMCGLCCELSDQEIKRR